MEEYQYAKRDISWLSFNHRVLQEAKDPTVPLYERLKFLAIYSANLDEFFRVRVAFLRSFKELKKKTRKKLDVKPKRELKEIWKIVQKQQNEFGAIFRNELLPGLEEKGIFLINEGKYTLDQQHFVRKLFTEKILPKLNPVFIDPTVPVPFLKNKGLYFIIELEGSKDLALVEIPSDQHPRFITLPELEGKHSITFLDDIIRFNLKELFNKSIKAAYAIKLSRDAELYIEDEYSGDLMEKLKRSLDKRNIGLPTRFLYDASIPEDLLIQLKSIFSLTKSDLIPGARYHNFNDFFGFPDPTNSPELHEKEFPPLPHPDLEHAPSIIEVLQKKEVMLHFPYQKYGYVSRLIQEAAEDTSVRSILITLYRVASKSAVVEALLQALKNGKEVTAFIEAKARFDEASNLYWGEELQKAGATVFYSYPGIKVHTKLLLISREEKGALKNYAYLGTGNFNEKTAKLYGDHALLTSDKRLTNEVVQVFNLLARRIIIPKCKHLFVAPFKLRQRFEKCINREIANAQAGNTAYMILKMNSLEDAGMIAKLYEASQAGVQVQLIVRGICCLVPGIEGMSENIEVISIVDRFLEHARVYIFANGGEEVMYIASADWMGRNLDRRVEVAIPIYGPEIKAEIKAIIDLQLEDNTKARIINASQNNNYKKRTVEGKAIRAQVETYNLLKRKV